MVYAPSNEPLDLGNLHAQKNAEVGTLKKKPKKERILLKEIGDDLDKLKGIQTNKLSRGQKQRIKRKIDKLEKKDSGPDQPEGENITMKNLNEQTKKPEVKAKVDKGESAKQKIENIMRKRDNKLMEKDRLKKMGVKAYLTDEDKKIMTDKKNNKREKRRQQSKDNAEDEFDGMLDKYKTKLLKKIQKTDKGGSAFEEVDYSD